ncbi:hypothetical protein JB92DRAFT_3104175 [Gautieria morchelliformis]|nr:hypothetical protein JB92DRAFT_3104175 [Gautieria morchelliformis]
MDNRDWTKNELLAHNIEVLERCEEEFFGSKSNKNKKCHSIPVTLRTTECLPSKTVHVRSASKSQSSFLAPRHHYKYHDHNRQPVAAKADAAFKPDQQKGAMDQAKDKLKVMVPYQGDPFSRNANENAELGFARNAAAFSHET